MHLCKLRFLDPKSRLNCKWHPKSSCRHQPLKLRSSNNNKHTSSCFKIRWPSNNKLRKLSSSKSCNKRWLSKECSQKSKEFQWPVSRSLQLTKHTKRSPKSWTRRRRVIMTTCTWTSTCHRKSTTPSPSSLKEETPLWSLRKNSLTGSPDTWSSRLIRNLSFKSKSNPNREIFKIVSERKKRKNLISKKSSKSEMLCYVLNKIY